jgi:ABC-2 type transport system permease protein
MSAPPGVQPAMLQPSRGLAVYSMWLRELVRFWRQKGRFAGALGTPLLFWLVLGAGFGDSFRSAPAGAPTGGSADPGYLVFFFPGIVVLTVLFTAIYSTISVIEDRQEGFLQGVLVAPVSRGVVVLGKMLGGTTLAWLQGALILLAAPLVGIHPGLVGTLSALLLLLLIAFALTGMGMVIAWVMDSTGGFHAIMNLLLMPMWMLSGAVFPYDAAHRVIRIGMVANPLSYGVDGLRHALGVSGAHTAYAWCWGLSGAFAAAMLVAAVGIARRRDGA